MQAIFDGTQLLILLVSRRNCLRTSKIFSGESGDPNLNLEIFGPVLLKSGLSIKRDIHPC
jgi:hypothetical protein